MDDRIIRVLIGSPVRQKPEILKEFFNSLRALSTSPLLEINYYFIDDNSDEASSSLLKQFAEAVPNVVIDKVIEGDFYDCNEKSHVWEETLIWKVAGFKNQLIKKAIDEGYDYLFLVDSDIILHPITLEHLVSLDLDIVSEIFWTKWEPDFPALPQVWLSDQYTLYESKQGETLTNSEMAARIGKFLAMLRVQGVYPVGGLGACTLISRNALLKGISFDKVYNVSFIGEDRHFCIRAAALGLKLFVDTHYPAYHIYRLSDLEGVEVYKKS